MWIIQLLNHQWPLSALTYLFRSNNYDISIYIYIYVYIVAILFSKSAVVTLNTRVWKLLHLRKYLFWGYNYYIWNCSCTTSLQLFKLVNLLYIVAIYIVWKHLKVSCFSSSAINIVALLPCITGISFTRLTPSSWRILKYESIHSVSFGYKSAAPSLELFKGATDGLLCSDPSACVNVYPSRESIVVQLSI